MLPPGHIAAGYLTAVIAVKIFRPEISQDQINQMYLWGMFWGFSPDLDAFWAFFRSNSLKLGPEHRQFFCHRPLVWIFFGTVLYLFVEDVFWKFNIVLLVLGSLSHFILDSIEYGVPWLWPIKSRLIALINPGKIIFVNREKSFFGYWLSFIKYYITRPTFYLEIVVIILALIVFFKI